MARKQAPPTAALVPVNKHPADLLNGKREMLSAWLSLYMELEVGASAENTAKAKRRDLQTFLDYFAATTGTDHPDQWTRSITTGFIRKLGKDKRPTTVNRVLATLRRGRAGGGLPGRPLVRGAAGLRAKKRTSCLRTSDADISVLPSGRTGGQWLFPRAVVASGAGRCGPLATSFGPIRAV